MHFQLAFRQTCSKLCLYGYGFGFRPTVYQSIICIPAPWEVRVLSRHPRIERVVHEQVCQHRADYTALGGTSGSFDPCAVLKFHRCFQPSFDVQHSPFALHAFADGTQ